MKSIMSWMGGKSRLVNKLLPLIPEHHCYVEVFSGAAWLYFAKKESKVEIINDINLDLITLYRVTKFHLDEFVRYLRWLLVSRDEFEKFKKQDPQTLTDIQKSVRFYYLVKNSYASRLTNPTFSISPTTRSSFNILRIEEDLSNAYLRLARTSLENRPYDQVIKKNDRPNTFYYLDPPYYGCEDYYGKEIFKEDDFLKLNEILLKLKGKFLLSLNDTKEVRKIYKGFKIRTVKTTYSCSAQAKSKKKEAKELFITNY